MKLLLFLFLNLLPSLVYAQTPIEREFYAYFGSDNEGPYSGNGYYEGYYSNSVVKINVDSIQENSQVIAIKIEYKLKAVEKLLLLRVPETGFRSDGSTLSEECLNAPVFIGGYTFDPTKNIHGIEFRIKAWCHKNRIIAFIKTIDGRIESGKKHFVVTRLLIEEDDQY